MNSPMASAINVKMRNKNTADRAIEERKVAKNNRNVMIIQVIN